MPKALLILITLLFPIALLSQAIFQNISFQEALNRSTATGQLIFLQFESSTCSQCNEVANKAFEDKELANQLEQTFICLKITPSHPDRETIATSYNVKESFGSFFIDHNKTLIHSYHKSSTRASDYKDQVDIALTKAGEDMRISELEKEYKNGNKSIGMMELLLWKRKSLNLETDSLLDEYVTALPPDSLKSIPALVFIAQMAPLIGSKGDMQLRKNFDLFNKAWYSLALNDRIGINNRINYKSMQKAIREKNEAFAYRVASFARSTYTSNPQGAAKAFEYNMINFYKETGDTTNYLIRAIYYYDNYYMTLSADSIKRKDSLNMKSLFQNPSSVSVNSGNTGTFQQVVQYAPITQNFSGELNNAAWNFYKISKEPLYLSKALQWAKRANEFYESPETMDTYARLLYKTGNKNEAIIWEEKAIALKKKRGFPVNEFELILTNMKQNREKIEN